MYINIVYARGHEIMKSDYMHELTRLIIEILSIAAASKLILDIHYYILYFLVYAYKLRWTSLSRCVICDEYAVILCNLCPQKWIRYYAVVLLLYLQPVWQQIFRLWNPLTLISCAKFLEYFTNPKQTLN